MIRYMLIYISKDIQMYFSFKYTSDSIIKLLEMFHVLCSCISNMKNIKGNIKPKKVSVVNTELSLKIKKVMLMMFSIDLVQYEM